MATFTALNIEPDDHTDDEVDNTKEIQIEEALKLYQAALKYHSQGVKYYSEAADAYTKLFASEIFRYPESQSEFERIYKNPELELDATFALGLELAAAGAEGAPSTLPQILYLAHKNHGQFILDCVKGRLKYEPMEKAGLDYQAQAAIGYFSRALVSDESDAELWRRAARVGAMLGSRRIARYCLEAAVEVDDDPTVTEVEPSSLEEGFAGEQLMEQLKVLSDDTALSHPIMAPFVKKTMPRFLTQHMDPYSFLPDPTRTLENPVLEGVPGQPHHIEARVDYRNWAAIGEQLWGYFYSPSGLSATGIKLLLPPELPPSPERAAIEAPPEVQDQVMKDLPTVESPAAEASEGAVATPVTSKSDEQPVETVVTTTTTVPLSDERRDSSVALPTRKRSQSTAGIRETPEDDSGAQKRSKRIRNRDSTLDGPPDPAAQYAEQLQAFARADEDVFSFVGGLLTKLGINDLGTLPDLRAALIQEEPSGREDIILNTAARDLRDILKTWDELKASAFITGNAAEILGSSSGTANAGLAAFLEHSKTGPLKISSIPIFDEASGLDAFAERVNEDWMPLQDVIYEWLRTILPTYTSHLWSNPLKASVVRLISLSHVELYKRLEYEIEMARAADGDLTQLEEMAETIFELNIDLYTQITLPNSVVEFEVRIRTKDQLARWSEFVGDVMSLRSYDLADPLLLRYIWASAFYATMTEDVSREHKVSCWSDLQNLLRDAGEVSIELQNNVVMPQISVDAAEREVSRLSTMDFFYNLFQTDTSDPLAIIETLEPVLDPESARDPHSGDGESPESSDNTPAVLKDMWKFLKTGSTSLRLFLWQRLREAYFSIGYNTKVFSCHLKSIEIIVEDLRSNDFIDSSDGTRQLKLLRWLKALDDLLVKALTIALNDAATCFEIIDDRHIKSTCAAIAQLSRVLHSAAVYDDEIRVGMVQLPQMQAFSLPNGNFNIFFNKLKEMQVRTWALQYTMIKEAMTQNRDLFQAPDSDLADYLSLVHYCLGMRKCCRASNKIFLKMMKVEMIRLKHVERWEDYLGQVLFDLYGIRLGVGTYLLEDHGCPTETLDRRTVLNIAEQVIMLANAMPMKDLLKHELRPTIEKMQTAVGPAKPSPQMSHNLRNITEFLKTSIRPLDLYKAWTGQVQVDSLPVNSPESPLADKGWYFLLGMIALTKFRSQKRLGPGAQQDDLRVAASFFRLQLQFDAEHWETWYRMAQCFDFELEEEVMWTADKVNNHRKDLVRLQRSAIHCYVMALSCAMRSADDSFATAEKLSEMYFEFGMRIYASSREPFGMEAFWVDDFEKHMSGAAGMYKKQLHDEMTRYRAWKYAAGLFKESLRDRPNYWMSHFMLGKCSWKMFCKADDEYDLKVKSNKPTHHDVLKAFGNAIKTVPKPRDSRQEPILEPHYKLVSIVHKIVMKRVMEPQAGADLLQQQPYGINRGEPITIETYEEWEPYIIKCLRHLRNFDKQHWHHRMISRVVGVLYDDANPEFLQAQAAISVFRESIFTKTMHIQVWKPDAERPGRHCVYMERYVRLMTKLLFIVNDKPNLEALVKRVRKKAPDFHRFAAVWTDCATTYLRLIRRAANVSASTDEVFKGETHEEFEALSDRLTAWIADPENQHPVLEALREASELKKLNSNAMKATPIDDLINDAWGMLYLQIAKTLPGPNPSSIGPVQVDGAVDAPPPAAPRPNPMNLTNLMMDMGNGTQIPVPVTFAGSEPSRPRKVGISRREVLRRAELAVNRPAEPVRALASASSRPRLNDPSPSLILGSNDGPKDRSASGSVSNSTSRNQNAGTGANDDQDGHDHDDQGGENENGERKDDEESERGSVHDSADDESDLSDVPDMEDMESEMVFPNLMSRSVSNNNPPESSVGTPKDS